MQTARVRVQLRLATQLELHGEIESKGQLPSRERDRVRVLINKAGVIISKQKVMSKVFTKRIVENIECPVETWTMRIWFWRGKSALFIVSLLDSFCILHLIKCAGGYWRAGNKKDKRRQRRHQNADKSAAHTLLIYGHTQRGTHTDTRAHTHAFIYAHIYSFMGCRLLPHLAKQLDMVSPWIRCSTRLCLIPLNPRHSVATVSLPCTRLKLATIRS